MTTVVVAGAGVIGASVTYHLARRGVRVHCVDAAASPAGGTTAVGFATATAYRRFPKAYFDINRAGIVEFGALAARFGAPPWWHRTGTLAWSDDEGFAGYLDLIADWGAPVVSHQGPAAVEAFGPAVDTPATGRVALLPDEGWIDAPAFTRFLLDEAVRAGATLVLGARITGVDRQNGRVASVALADGTVLAADAMVNATGSAADDVAALAGARPFLGPPRRSLVAHLLVSGDPVPYIVRAPDVSLRPDGPGRVMVRSDQVDKQLPAGSDTPDPEQLKDLLGRATRAVPLLSAATVDDASIVAARCARDELPSVGLLSAVPGYLEAVASAGVTLAPVFGRALAGLIVDGVTDPLIAPFGPDRFGR